MISLEMSSTPPVVTNNTSAGTGDDHEPSDEVATTSNGRHLDSEEEEILLSDDEYASLPPEPVQENGSQSFSPYKSPNSKIKDLIESPILNKSRMISRRGDDDAEDQVFEEPDPANSDDNNPTVALHFDATPELSRSNDRQIVNTPSTAIDSVAPEKFDVSPEANSTAASAAHAGAFKSSTEQNQDDPGSSPSGSQQKLPALTASQRAITSYMVPRHGSPRAMAMLKAAAKAGGSRSPAVVSVESGDVDSNSASVTTNGLNPLRRTTRNSLISSSPSSTTLKRSHSVGDPSGSTTTINSSPQSSPKRSSTYVPRTRGSLALQAAMRSSLASSATQYSTPVAAAPSPGPDELSHDSSTTLPANGASSFTPLARGSVCLQAAKAKQAEKFRRDTPMPKRAQSLPGQASASTSLAAADTPLKPKSILRTSLSKDDSKSLYNARNFFNLPEIGRKPKRVLFTEPLVTSSVEFDANSSHLVICDTSTNSNVTQQQANNGGAESGTTASSAVQPAPNTLATGQPVGVIVSNGTAAVASTVGHSEASMESSTGGGAIRRKPLYHQNSTFEDCDSFSPSKRSKTEHHQTRSPRPPPPPPAPVYDDDDDDDIEEIPETDPEDNDEEEMSPPPVKESKTEPSSSTSQYATPPSTPTRTTTTTTSMISDNNATSVLQSSTVISSKPYKRQQPDAEDETDDVLEEEEDNGSGMYSVTMKSYAEINEMSKRYRGVSAESMEQENQQDATADQEEVMDISDESSRESRDESSQEDESTTSSAAEEDTTMTCAAVATQSKGALPSASEQELASSIVSTESSVMTFDHHPLTQAQFQTHRGSDEDNSAKLLYSADSLDNAAGPSASSAATQPRSNDNLEADAFMADDANEPMIEMRIPLRLARSFHRYLGEYLKMYESKVAQREQRRRLNGGGKGNF